MGEYLTTLSWEVLRSGHRRLNDDLVYKLDADLADRVGLEIITVPAHFVSDGYSFPWPTGWPSLMGGPYEVAPEAATVHDYLCVNPEITGSRALSTEIFKRAMKDCGVGWIRRNILWSAVRAYEIASFKK